LSEALAIEETENEKRKSPLAEVGLSALPLIEHRTLDEWGTGHWWRDKLDKKEKKQDWQALIEVRL
jgi:hypothetical protein